MRGYDAPEEDASDADVRGALLKALSDEVLTERECALKGVAYDPYVNARPRAGGGGEDGDEDGDAERAGARGRGIVVVEAWESRDEDRG